MVKLLSSLAVVGSAYAAPEDGCYYFKLPVQAMDVQAQVQVNPSSTLDFSVYMKVGQKPAISHSCSGEAFTWNEADQSIVVGEPASQCLSDLQAMTRGALALPVTFRYNSDKKSFGATFLMVPVELIKTPQCNAFPVTPAGAPGTTASPSDATVTIPSSGNESPSGVADEPTDTPKGVEALTIGLAIIASILVVL